MSSATVEAPAKVTRPPTGEGKLPETMRAIVAYAPGDYRFETVPVPRAGADEIIIKVEACGICAGDIKAYVGAESFWGGNGQPPYIKAPMIPGHEFVGHVVELGENVARKGEVKIGERLISQQIAHGWGSRFWQTRGILDVRETRRLRFSE